LRPSLPLVALVAAAAALALVAAYATVNSDRSYYAYGDITSANEAVNIKVYRDSFTLSAGGQGVDYFGRGGILYSNKSGVTPNPHATWLLVERQGDVENVKIRIEWVNAKQVAHYFDYVKILIQLGKLTVDNASSNDMNVSADFSNPQVKGLLTLRKNTAIITLDDNDFTKITIHHYRGGTSDLVINAAPLRLVVYYEGKEGMMETNLPLIFNVKLLQTS